MATCIPAFVWKFQFRRVARVRDACLVDAVPPRVKRFRVFVRILFFFFLSLFAGLFVATFIGVICIARTGVLIF